MPLRCPSIGARFSGGCRAVCMARDTLRFLCFPSVSWEGAVRLISSRRGFEAVVAQRCALAACERHRHIPFNGTGIRVPRSLVTEHIGRLAPLIRRVAIGESICARRCAPGEGGWTRRGSVGSDSGKSSVLLSGADLLMPACPSLDPLGRSGREEAAAEADQSVSAAGG